MLKLANLQCPSLYFVTLPAEEILGDGVQGVDQQGDGQQGGG